MSLDRRKLLQIISTAAAFEYSSVWTLSRALAAAKKPASMADWMDAWTGVKSRDPHGGLFVYRFKEPMWALLKPISWTPSIGQPSLARVDVPNGFVTDFASIPRAFWSLLRPDGDYTYPAILHDYLYWTQERSREDCDAVIRYSMMDFQIPTLTREAIYQGVRKFGQTAWDGNAKLKAAGEKRILIQLPDDPRVTWMEWKTRPGVFAP